MLYDPKWEQSTTLEPWRKLLLKAADLIDQHGLAKFAQELPDGSMCIAGAINLADGVTKLPHHFTGVRVEAANRIGVFCGGAYNKDRDYGYGDDFCHDAFVTFNNHPDTTKEMVVEKLRSCALQPELVA